jgi:hypothetical protein
MRFTTFFRLCYRPARRRSPRPRLGLERLEDRSVPSANIDVSHTPGSEVETNIDLNPVNPQNLVATAIHVDFSQASFTLDAASFSRDGGQTWGPSSPLPRSFQGHDFVRSGDPTVAFDSRGNVYVSYGVANVGPLGFQRAILVARSSDGGETFTQFTAPAISTTDPGLILDHPKVAVDHSPSSPFRDSVYVTWITESASGQQDLLFSRSTDGGLSWSAPQTLDNAGTSVQLNTQAVGPDGTIYITYVQDDPTGHSTQFVARSTDGGVTFGRRVAVTALHASPDFAGETFSSPAQPTLFFGPSVVLAQASLDVDRSAGPFRGRLYLAYSDRPDPGDRPFDMDVYVQFSDDHGATWSPRQRVNDDGPGNSQFFPSVSVDPTTGKVLISWYDTRRDPANLQKTDVFLAVGSSSRQGVHFRPNLRVTDQQSDESVNNPQAIGWYGDYEGLVAYGGVAHPVWIDARASNFSAGLGAEVYTAAVRYGDDDDSGGDTGPPARLEIAGAARASFSGAAATTAGTLTFAPGETTKTITIEVKGDSKKEADETFYLDLFGLSGNALFSKKRGRGTILNDD